MLGAPLGVALWALLGFFNGIAQPRVAVLTTALVAVVNAFLNWLFIFELDYGIAGSAWATNVSMLCGLGARAVGCSSVRRYRAEVRSHLTWRPDRRSLARQYRLGLPMGAMYAADLFGMALFQLMQVRLGAVDGAATQIVMMLTSMSYMPASASPWPAPRWSASRSARATATGPAGSATSSSSLTIAFMGTLGVLVALAGPWLLPHLPERRRPAVPPTSCALGVMLLWIAAGYQVFDALNLGSGFCAARRRRRRGARRCCSSLCRLGRVRAAGALAVFRARPGLGRLPAAVSGYGAAGGWIGAAGLRRAARQRAVPALALGPLAPVEDMKRCNRS